MEEDAPGRRGRGAEDPRVEHPRRPRNRKRAQRPDGETLAWLARKPALEDLIDRYPLEWNRATREVRELLTRDDQNEVQRFLAAVANPERPRPGARLRSNAERASSEARRQMTAHLLKQSILRATTGVHEGRVRFNLIQGYVLQRLLFKTGLERKPVSMLRFRLCWRLIRQRRLLMPLVQPQGIWCFYSSALLRELADLIGDRRCLEIAAGDGTLSRFLARRGVDVIATDDYSWSDNIDFPADVKKMDARRALNELQTEVVLCSWPPAGNSFEKQVFQAKHVQTYIVIGSGSKVSTGDWDTYSKQATFEVISSRRLSRLVLPPEVDHEVLVFQRKPPRESPSTSHTRADH